MAPWPNLAYLNLRSQVSYIDVPRTRDEQSVIPHRGENVVKNVSCDNLMLVPFRL